MHLNIQYQFTAMPWRYNGPASWYFVSLPRELSKEIKAAFGAEEAGWGRLTVTARIGSSEWKTAVWFDSKMNTYLLPLKAEIRKNEHIELNKTLTVAVFV